MVGILSGRNFMKNNHQHYGNEEFLHSCMGQTLIISLSSLHAPFS